MAEGDNQDGGNQEGNQATLDNQDDQGNQDSWQAGLSSADLRNNPTLQKYATQEEAHKGHLKLQESFGMDKFVWPKDENDTERHAELNKRLGVPGTPEGYGLEDIANPEGVELFNKVEFQQMMSDAGARPEVAAKLWGAYTDKMKGGYAEANAKFQTGVDNAKAELMKEWGSAYESNIEMGQRVIDTLSDSQEQNDYLTVALAQDAKGSRFLAKIGKQYAESSIGGFQNNQNFTYTSEEARRELDIIKANPDYRSDDERVRKPLIDRANDLMRQINPGM